MKIFKCLFLLCFAIVSLFFSSHAYAQQFPIKDIKTAWIGEHEKFIVWYAKKHGWDKKHGLKLQILDFDTGRSILNGINAYNWAIAGVGAVPALTSNHKDDIRIIAIANNESNSNILYAKENSPVFSVKGYNSEYANIYGSPETVKNMKILCTKGSSAHYLVDAWLSALGLTEKDVKMQFMDMTPAFSSFKGGYGDVIGVWSPDTIKAEKLGYKAIAKGDTCKVFQPVLIVANERYMKKNPETVMTFLKMYMEGIEMLRTMPMEEIIPEYQKFFDEEIGLKITAEEALFDLRNHPVFTLDEQRVLFDNKNGKSIIQDWLLEIVNFYDHQRYSTRDIQVTEIKTIDPIVINQLK